MVNGSFLEYVRMTHADEVMSHKHMQIKQSGFCSGSISSQNTIKHMKENNKSSEKCPG